MYSLRKLFNPEIFQGKYKKKNYFEGWYYKIVNKDESRSIAFIPGIAYNEDGQGHSFIQVIDSIEYKTKYFKFPITDFIYSEKELKIRIGNNTFTKDAIHINLQDKDYSVEGRLNFYDIEAFPKKITRPGIMGPFSFVPFMECYHGVVNIHQKIDGELKINDHTRDFTKGNGYIEKDWGRSFPKWYVWLQCNHFTKEDASLMFSIANIPWLKNYFTGFLAFLKLKDEFYLFATYTGAKVKKLEYKDEKIEIEIQDRKYLLSISGEYKKSGILKAPKNGLMERLISESISSNIKVVLKDKSGELIYEDLGEHAGFEVVGKHL